MKVKSLIMATTVAIFFNSSARAAELSLQERVYLLENQLQTKASLQTQMSLQIIELQKEVKDLRGLVEEQNYQLQQIQDRQRDLYREFEMRLSSVGSQTSNSTQPTQPAQVLPGQTTNNTPTPSVNAINLTAQVKDALDTNANPRAEFEAAFALVRERNYPKAVESLTAFLKKYPQGDFSDNARYWVGQVYFAQGKLDEADQHFARLQSDYPQSGKISAALLKQAEIAVQKQDWSKARTLYQKVESSYSGTPQQLARKGLQDLKKSGK